MATVTVPNCPCCRPPSGSGSGSASGGVVLTCDNYPQGNLPATLYYAIATTVPAAACVNGATGTLGYTPVSQLWESAGFPFCNNPFVFQRWRFSCKFPGTIPLYALTMVNMSLCGVPNVPFLPVAATTAPFSMTFVVPVCGFVDGYTGSGTATVVISE